MNVFILDADQCLIIDVDGEQHTPSHVYTRDEAETWVLNEYKKTVLKQVNEYTSEATGMYNSSTTTWYVMY